MHRNAPLSSIKNRKISGSQTPSPRRRTDLHFSFWGDLKCRTWK